MTTAQTCIDHLALLPHPEGGYYRETYRSAATMAVPGSTPDTPAQRNVCTGIYFLLEAGNFSAFHRIQSDEMWHFYAGQALEVLEIDDAGTLIRTRLGPDFMNGDVPQYVVPAGRWFSSRVMPGGTFSLVGCTVAPGFDFADFELADRQWLANKFPCHKNLVLELTRETY